MEFRVDVFRGDSRSATVDLKLGKSRVGSHRGCEIHVDSDEIADLSAEIELRGATVFVRNRNDFPIYLGQEILPPQMESEWHLQDSLQLSPQIILALVAGSRDEPTSDPVNPDPTKWKRSSFQIGVIMICAILAAYMLANDGKETAASHQLTYSFDDLVNDFHVLGGELPDKPGLLPQLTSQDRQMWAYLREARRLERRWNTPDRRKRAFDAYGLLIAYDPVRTTDINAAQIEPTSATELRLRLRARIKQFANARLDELGVNGLTTP